MLQSVYEKIRLVVENRTPINPQMITDTTIAFKDDVNLLINWGEAGL